MVKLLKEIMSPDSWTFDDEEANPEYTLADWEWELFENVQEVFNVDIDEFDPDDYDIYWDCSNYEELAKECIESYGGWDESLSGYFDEDTLREDLEENMWGDYLYEYKQDHPDEEYDEHDVHEEFLDYFNDFIEDILGDPYDFFDGDMGHLFNYHGYGADIDYQLNGDFTSRGNYVYKI